MLKSLKNKGRTLGLVALLGVCTSTLAGCVTPTSNSGELNPKMKYAIEQQLQMRRKAIYTPGSFGSNSPLGADKYPAQDRNTIGEQNPDFKGMPLPEEKTWEQQAEEMKGREHQPMGKAPWNVPPGYQSPYTK